MEKLEKILNEIQNENLYKILGIDRTDDLHTIKRAYKKSVKHHHPDKNKEKDTVEIFQKIQKAYEVLKSEEMKAAYDSHLDKKELNKTRLENLDSERKKFADDLRKREEENYRDIQRERDENILNKKHQRENFSNCFKFSNQTNESNSHPKKKTFEEKLKNTGIKIKWSKDLQFVITKETIQSYFKDFGIIDEIVCRSDSNKAFILFSSESNFSQTLNMIKSDKVIKQLFKIKRLNKLNSDEKVEEYDKIKSSYLDTNILNKIKNMKMQNNIEFMKSNMENFESKVNLGKTDLNKEKESSNLREDNNPSAHFHTAGHMNNLLNMNLDDFEKQAFEKLKMKSKK